MRQSLLVLSLISMLPTIGFAEPANPSCNVVDREALVALKLENATMKAEHQAIPGAIGAPNQGMDTCTITARDTPLPSLTVTTAALPADAKPVKPSCKWQAVPGAGLDVAICNATANQTFITFALTTKNASDSGMKTIFTAQVERLVDRVSQSSSKKLLTNN